MQEYTRIIPESKSAVLFIHGILGSPEHFSAFLPIVPENISVKNLLLDGHGKNAEDFSRTSMKKWKNQVRIAIADLAKQHDNILIAAHSMGTLLAIGAASEFPQVKSMFLLASPLKIHVKLLAVRNSLKVLFGKVSENEPLTVATRDACSVSLPKNPFSLIGWIPRFVELFRESAATRKSLPNLSVPCKVFQSAHDELVSAKSRRFLQDHPEIQFNILENSYHFYYAPIDLSLLLTEFSKELEKY